jgi:tRNA G10  N-methylase Trm11
VLADLANQSVDAVVCDPPYNREGLPSYSALSEVAARVLKPGRLCVTDCGKAWLPDHFDRLAEHLDYVWTGAIFLPGRHTVFRHKMIFGRWRPSSPPARMTCAPRSSMRSWPKERRERTGRTIPGSRRSVPLVALSKWAARPGELVVDPFLGFGTTALACLATGRRFLGCDVDPGAVSLALERLQAANEHSA